MRSINRSVIIIMLCLCLGFDGVCSIVKCEKGCELKLAEGDDGRIVAQSSKDKPYIVVNPCNPGDEVVSWDIHDYSINPDLDTYSCVIR